MVEASAIQLPSIASAIALAGQREENLQILSRQTGAKLVLRGQDLLISGTTKQVALCSNLVQSLESLWGVGDPVFGVDILTARQAINTKRLASCQGTCNKRSTPIFAPSTMPCMSWLMRRK